MKTCFSSLLCVLLLSVSAPARAGGMEFPENGARAMARGGAFVARADDPAAIVLNPAGLARVKGVQLLFDSNLVWQDLCYRKSGTYPGTPEAGSYAGQAYPNVCRDISTPFYLPTVVVTYDFGLPKWTFALGVYGPHAVAHRRFPTTVLVNDPNGDAVEAPSPTRYHLEELKSLVGYWSAAAAWRPLRWLQVGAALQLVYGQFRFATWVPLTSDPENELRFSVRTRGVHVTGLMGVLANPVAGLHLGVAVRAPVKLPTTGNADIQLPDSFAGLEDAVTWHDGAPQAEMPVELPLVVRSGVRYEWAQPEKGKDAPPLVDLELDAIWEQWSTVETMDIRLNADFLGSELPEFKLNHFYKDVLSLRLGGSFTVPRPVLGGWLSFHLGTHYANTASPRAYTRLNYAAWARLGIHAGVGLRMHGMELTLAFSHIWNGDGRFGQPWTFRATRRVAASCVQPINPLASEAQEICDPTALSASDQETDIARGTYRASYTTLSIGLRVRFDAVARAIRQAR